MPKFQITFICREEKVPTIVSLLISEVEGFSVQALDAPARPRTTRAEPTQFEAQVLEVLQRAGAPMHFRDVCESLARIEGLNGKPESASPALSNLKKKGYVDQVSRGVWSIK